MSDLRLDVSLVKRGLAPSRERAQEAIRAGMVCVNGAVATRASQRLTESDRLEVTGDPIGFVSRGGLKLQAALDAFGIDPAGRVCLDAGASTGGFTDCLLRRGAARVHAVDVGHGQLHESLRADPRVVSMEETDLRTLTQLPQPADMGAVDVSFISLTLVLPALHRLLAPGATLVALIKPQFEVGPAGLGKGGIVKDDALKQEAVERVLEAARETGFSVLACITSPVLGTEGNAEYLAHLTRPLNGAQASRLHPEPRTLDS